MAITVNYEPNPALTGYLEAYGAAGQSAQQGAQMLEQQQERQHQQRMQEAQFAEQQQQHILSRFPSPRDLWTEQRANQAQQQAFHQQQFLQRGRFEQQQALQGAKLSQQETLDTQKMENSLSQLENWRDTGRISMDEFDQMHNQLMSILGPRRARAAQAQVMQTEGQQQQAMQQAHAGLTTVTHPSTGIPITDPTTGEHVLFQRMPNGTLQALIQHQQRPPATPRWENFQAHAATYSGLRAHAQDAIEKQMETETNNAYRTTANQTSGVADLQRPWMRDAALRHAELMRRLGWWEHNNRTHPGHPDNAPGLAESRAGNAQEAAAALNQTVQQLQQPVGPFPQRRGG